MCVQAQPQSLEVEQSQQSDSNAPQAATETPVNHQAPSSGSKTQDNQETSRSVPIDSAAIEAADSSRGEGLEPARRPDAEMHLANARSEPALVAAPRPANDTAAEPAIPARKPLNLDTATQLGNSAWFCVVPLVQPSASAEPVSRGSSDSVLHRICICFPWVILLPAHHDSSGTAGVTVSLRTAHPLQLDVDWLAVRRTSGPQLEQLRWPSQYSEDLESKAPVIALPTLDAGGLVHILLTSKWPRCIVD